MEIVCKSCNTSHYLSDDRIPLETKTGKCKQCSAPITVLGENATVSIEPTPIKSTNENLRLHIMSKNEAQSNFNNPLEGNIGTSIFFALVFIQTSLVFLVCSNIQFINFSIIHLIFKLFLIAVFLGLFSFAISEDIKSFFVTLFYTIVTYGITLTTAIFLKNTMNFWLALCISNILIFLITDFKKLEIIVKFYVLWIVTVTIITIGNVEYFPYAKPAIDEFKEIYFFDVRVIIISSLFLCFFIKAIWKSIAEDRPTILSIPNLRIPDILNSQTSIISTIFRPFVISINGILFATQIALNILWKLIAVVAVYLTRFSLNFICQLLFFITNSAIWKAIFYTLITFFPIMIFIYGTIFVTPHIFTYLIQETPLYSISFEDTIVWISLFFISSLLIILIVCELWRFLDWHSNEFLIRTLFGGSMILISYAFSSAIMYIATHIEYFQIRGFQSLGGFSFLISCVIAFVFVIQVIKLIFNYDK
ncbi:hypothetical protein BCS42_12335 [Crenothrix sp. D3]|nr:hypothetical protein BCS42_12335 [Crenothrix sp. D3]